MCVGRIAEVIEVSGDGVAEVDVDGRILRISLLAVDEPVAAGDWLLVHSGVAVLRLTADDAAHRRDLLRQLEGEPS
jgi:hydrogenase assembly chaperone HypC/HupF